MTDHFALLHQPRRPWLDPGQLKATFLQHSAAVHPDRVHSLGESERAEAQLRYVELNAAYQCLRDPRERIRHLLHLESGSAPQDIKQIPEPLMQQFFRVGATCRTADGLIKEKAQITSPLLKVQWFQKSQEQSDALTTFIAELKGERDAALERVKQIDAGWLPSSGSSEDQALRTELETLHHILGFYDRWIAQMQERVAQLAF